MADIAEMKAALQAALSGDTKQIGNTSSKDDVSKLVMDSQPGPAGAVKAGGTAITDVGAVRSPPGYDAGPSSPGRTDASQSRGAQAALKGTVKVAGKKSTAAEAPRDIKEPWPKHRSTPTTKPKVQMPGSGF